MTNAGTHKSRANVAQIGAAAWMASRGWKPFPFQRSAWKALAEGRSGLVHATTGTGKTYALWLGALQHFAAPASPRAVACKTTGVAPPLTVLWITPMRALASDTLHALQEPLPALAPHWTSGVRTGDTPSRDRSAQDRRLPTVLVTTPESVSLLLARTDAHERLQHVQLVVVDEWHELLGNKRGVQTQLALARLSGWNPALQVWGLSATLGNLNEALHALVPQPPPDFPRPHPVLVHARITKSLHVDALLPDRLERFAWAGHMGLSMLAQVVRVIAESATTLVFTNTRSQSERWYQAILQDRPDWAGAMALHHGSLDPSVRSWVERGLKTGQLKAVVCTSSLDLGVDFLPVERVLQIGSAKGVGRLMQRAGRSGHAPGRASSITLVPTHSLELVEAAALRRAVIQGHMESRHSPKAPLDVLVQHLVTVALGGGFEPAALLAEVRRTAAYATLTEREWQWALLFVRQGGESLATYPDFQRVAPDESGVWRVPDARLARRHRSNIGTIVSDASMQVQFVSGGRLGSVEESFVARLRKGDVFLFAGRMLELVRTQQMTAYVRSAARGSAAMPRWSGGRMPLSDTLAAAMLELLAQADQGVFPGPEMQCVKPLLTVQAAWSAIPTPNRLVAETLKTREGWHLFLYPLAGRLVHQGLAGLLAWRAARQVPNTFSIAVNDYGLELLCAKAVDWQQLLPTLIAPDPSFTDGDGLAKEMLDSLNASEMARRRFREIARIAGLVFQSHPGEQRSSRQIQASASLYYDVFNEYDPDNLLLDQARSELLSSELDVTRLAHTLRTMQRQTLHSTALVRPTPLALPLMVERFRERLSTESLAERLGRMVQSLERAAPTTATPRLGRGTRQVATPASTQRPATPRKSPPHGH